MATIEMSSDELNAMIVEKDASIFLLERQVAQIRSAYLELLGKWEALPSTKKLRKKEAEERTMAVNIQQEFERRRREAQEWDDAHPQETPQTADEILAAVRAEKGEDTQPAETPAEE